MLIVFGVECINDLSKFSKKESRYLKIQHFHDINMIIETDSDSDWSRGGKSISIQQL